MIQLLPQLKILLAYQPVDFRKGIDGLIGLCRDHLDLEIYDGTLFVFRNRRGTALKVLTFDGVGWWLVIRRFSQGRLQWWPKAQADTLTHPLEAQQLQVRACQNFCVHKVSDTLRSDPSQETYQSARRSQSV
jgi:transposase